jgi:hypothetical protein
MLTRCGVCCSKDCKAYGTECRGCEALAGRVPWAPYYGKEHCPIYECTMQRGLLSCGDCGQAPCRVWQATRNPDASDEAFNADIHSRLRNLEKRRSDKHRLELGLRPDDASK